MGRAWVKLPTDTKRRLDLALAAETPSMRTSAELLYRRGWEWCGDAESAGFIPRATVTGALESRQPVARVLVERGLWDAMPSGFNVLGWEELQASPDELGARRLADKLRKQAERARKQAAAEAAAEAASRDTSQPGSRDVTAADVELDAATASQQQQAPPPIGLPPELEILRGKLHARRLFVRWDTLTASQVEEVVALQRLHGDNPLIESAVRAFRADNPAQYATAWLGHWRALPDPSRRLAIVTEKCSEHLQELPCGGCAADLKAANRGA